MKTTKSDAFWQSFCEAKGIEGKNYDVVAFGDSPAMADELAALVVHGPKRATAGLLRDYEGEPTAVPVIGGYAVVVNGDGDPLCVFQTTDVRIGPLSSVDDSFAWDEGEGDRTREWWLAAHKLYEGHFHDLLNDFGKEAVMADIKAWIEARLPAI